MRSNPATPSGPRTVTVQLPDIPARKPLPRQQYVGGTTVVQVDDLTRLLTRPEPTAHCRTHGAYWPMYLVDGVPTCPYEVTDLLLDGAAVLLSDEEGSFRLAEAVLNDLDRRADLMGDRPRYERPLTAARLLQGAAMRRRYDALIEQVQAADARHDVPLLLTVDEVAAIFHVSERTIRRWAGQRLPAPVRIGRRLLFRATAIERHIMKASDGAAVFREAEATEQAVTAARQRRERREAAQDLATARGGWR